MKLLDAMKNPPREYSPAAFWFWYGDLEPEQLRQQIRMMVEQGVYNGFMHARAYLKTPYLGEDWWKAIAACIDEGEKVDFYPWLYDEYAWPSGTAGSTFNHGHQAPSRTLAKGPCNMSKSLTPRTFDTVEDFLQDYAGTKQTPYRNLVSVFTGEGDQWTLRINALADPDADPAAVLSGETGKLLAFYELIHNRFVDYLTPDPIREFMDYTHEEYKKRFGEYFGNRVPGLFFDEIFMILNMPWTWRFAEEFIKRRGYDLLPKMAALAIEGGEAERQVRLDYFKTVAELYEESFFQQISQWCEENKLNFTGHIEEWLTKHPGRQGNFFWNMRHLTTPGADCHDYRYRFPRKITYREPKFAVAVARAYGKKRAMSEALGGAGWGCSLQQFKRGINTIGAMGISMITLHGFYKECDSQGTQADWPNSFFYQNPYWRYFKHFADYINRICYMNAQGKPVVDVGLYYPITEMQAEFVAAHPTKAGWLLDAGFNDALVDLIENQIDTDFIDDESLLKATVKDGRICVGHQAFRVLVFPETAIISSELQEKLNAFTAAGGHVLQYACTENSSATPANCTAEAVKSLVQPDVTVIRGAKDNLYVNHRSIGEENESREVYFIANSFGRKRSQTLLLREKGSVERLSPEDGSISTVNYRVTDRGTEVDLVLEPDESCWLMVDTRQAMAVAQLPAKKVLEELSVVGKWDFLPVEWDMPGEQQINAEKTELQIPLAAFSSDLHPDGRQIRIWNKKGEPGHCGRHLSLWKGAWIGRRPDWIDNAPKEMLYFRRNITLAEKPEKAEMCIVAVNRWTLWINGKQVMEHISDRTPLTVDLAPYLTEGENLLAVQVYNPTPMEHFNLLSCETLPPEEIISLLAEIRVTQSGKTQTICTDNSWVVTDQFYEGWEQPDYTPAIFEAHATTAIEFGDDLLEGKWLLAWERGTPPLLPWGDIPLFGELVRFPRRLAYSLVLPAGTARIFAPELTGTDVSVTVDGMPICWDNGSYAMRPDCNPHQLQITMQVQDASQGLHAPVRVEVIPFRSALCDWRLHGLKWYAGFARYRNMLRLTKKPGRYILSLGQTSFQAEVWINGVKAGERVWEPYQLDVTDLLKDGENEFKVIVSNSAAVERQFMLVDEGMALGWNRYWNDDNIQREGENLVSGMQGLVLLTRIEA